MMVSMKPYTLAVYSNNQKKLNELTEAFKAFSINVCSYLDILDPINVLEDGTTFEQNATKKVAALPVIENTLYLADDSGIEIEALNGEPGVLSARYAGDNATDTDRCKKILQHLTHTPNRNAQFKCVIALKLPNKKIILKSGIIKGSISQTLKGETGFGYDPIFIPNGYQKTFAELGSETKQRISHRGLAISLIKKYLETSFK